MAANLAPPQGLDAPDQNGERQAIEAQRQAALQAAKQQYDQERQAAQQEYQAALEAAKAAYDSAVADARRDVPEGATEEEAAAAREAQESAISAAREQYEQAKNDAKAAYDAALQQAQANYEGQVQNAEQQAEQALSNLDQQEEQQIEQEATAPPLDPALDPNIPYRPNLPGGTGGGDARQPPLPGGTGGGSAVAAPPTPGSIAGRAPGQEDLPFQDLDQDGIDDLVEMYRQATAGGPGILRPRPPDDAPINPYRPPTNIDLGDIGDLSTPSADYSPSPTVGTPAPVEQAVVETAAERLLDRIGVQPLQGQALQDQVARNTFAEDAQYQQAIAQLPAYNPPNIRPASEMPLQDMPLPEGLETVRPSSEIPLQDMPLPQPSQPAGAFTRSWGASAADSAPAAPEPFMKTAPPTTPAVSVGAPGALPPPPSSVVAPPPVDVSQAPIGAGPNAPAVVPGAPAQLYEEPGKGWVLIPPDGSNPRMINSDQAIGLVRRGQALPVGPSAGALVKASGVSPDQIDQLQQRYTTPTASAIPSSTERRPYDGTLPVIENLPYDGTKPIVERAYDGTVNMPPVSGLTPWAREAGDAGTLKPSERAPVGPPAAPQDDPQQSNIYGPLYADVGSNAATTGATLAPRSLMDEVVNTDPNHPTEVATPQHPAYDRTLQNPNFSFERINNPRPEDYWKVSTVLDQSLSMLDAQRAGSGNIPLREIPDEERSITADAIGAMARGDKGGAWAMDALYNAARQAWKKEQGNPAIDAKFADPGYQARWVNSFLEGREELPLQKELAEDLRRQGKPAPADIAASRNGPVWLGKFGKDLGASVQKDGIDPAKNITVPQVAQMTAKYGLSASATSVACGVLASHGMIRAANGDDSIPLDQVFQAASSKGYWTANGWTGPVSFGRFLNNVYGKETQVMSQQRWDPSALGDMAGKTVMGQNQATIEAAIKEDVAAGKPVSLSVGGANGHYYVATDYRPEDDRYYVGTTGTAYAGGKTWMSAKEMKVLSGNGVNDTAFTAIRLVGDVKSNRKGTPLRSVEPRLVTALGDDKITPIEQRPSTPASSQTPAAKPSPYNRMSYTGPVDDRSHASRNGTGPGEIEDYIRRSAEARGMNVDEAMIVAQNEGGLTNPIKRNNNLEPAWTPYQLHVVAEDPRPGQAAARRIALQNPSQGYVGDRFIAATGMHPSDPKAWKAAVDFALDEAIKKGSWQEWYGAKHLPRGQATPVRGKPLGISEEARYYAGLTDDPGRPTAGTNVRERGPSAVEFNPDVELDTSQVEDRRGNRLVRDMYPHPGSDQPLPAPRIDTHWGNSPTSERDDYLTRVERGEINPRFAPELPAYAPPDPTMNNRGTPIGAGRYGAPSTGAVGPPVNRDSSEAAPPPPPPWDMDAVYATAKQIKGTPAENIDEAYNTVRKAFSQWGMDDDETIAAALATMLVETGTGKTSFKPIKELQNLDGSYVTKPSGGTKFVGRGYVQLTHDYNYRDTGKAISEATGRNVDLENDPDQALDPEIAAHAMAQFFKSRGLDQLAKQGRWDEIRRKVNGGETHIAEYRKLLQAMGYNTGRPARAA